MARMIEDPSKPERYVLKADRDRPENEQSVFLLLPLTVKLQRDLARDREANQGGDGALLKRHLRGWENYPTGADGNHRFEVGDDGAPTEATLDRIPFADRTELAIAVLGAGAVAL